MSKCASKTLLFKFRAGSLTADTSGGGCILGAARDELLRDLFLPFIWYYKKNVTVLNNIIYIYFSLSFSNICEAINNRVRVVMYSGTNFGRGSLNLSCNGLQSHANVTKIY